MSPRLRLRVFSQGLQWLLVVAALLALLWGGICLDLQRSRDTLRGRVESDISNLSLAFSKQIESSINIIDMTLVDLRDFWAGSAEHFAVVVRSRQSYLDHELAFQVAIIGADGLLIFSSLEQAAKPVDLSDREHFKVHKDRVTDELFISKPLLGRVSKRWSIQFTRPIYDRKEKFQGVIVLSVSPEYFYGFYRSVHLPPGSSITLVRRDGEVLSRYPNPDQALGKKVANTPFLEAATPVAGAYTSRSQIDGVERFFAWRRVDRQDAVVVVGHAVQGVMAPYLEQRNRAVLAGSGLSALLLLVSYLLFKSARQRHAAARSLAGNEERWRLALEAAGDGVWDWDISASRVIYSTGWKTMLGFEPQDIGQSRDEWKRRVHPQDMPAIVQAVDSHLKGSTRVYRAEYRMRTRDDGWKWILDRGMVIARQPDGTPLRMVGTHTDISTRKQLEHELMKLATTDALTGLCNRRHFLERLELEMRRCRRYPASQAAVLMVDIDFFKKINDHHGHAVGDAALKHFSSLLLHEIRDNDVAGRLGGEEFAVLLIEVDSARAAQFADRLCAHLRQAPLLAGEQIITMSVSIGISMLRAEDANCEAVLHRADLALYQAKRDGRDRVVLEAAAGA